MPAAAPRPRFPAAAQPRRHRRWHASLPAALLAAALLAAAPPPARAEGTAIELTTTWKDRTPPVQDDACNALLKKAAAGLPAGERVAHAALMQAPGEHRGRAVHVEGVILGEPVAKGLEPVPLAPGENPPDLRRACECVILDPVAGTTYAVTFLEPGPRPAAHGRIVFDAAFWKVVTYRNRRGDTVAAPYLIARTWALEKKAEGPGAIPILMAITGGLAIASIMVGAQASRRRVE